MDKINGSKGVRDKNIMTVPDRIGEIAGIILVTLVTAFFAYHLAGDTGFITSDFGITGLILLFGSASISIIASGARAIIGRRDRSRPFELASAAYWAIASLWFLVVFPFNFAHLSDPLPLHMKFFLSWISNGIGWVILLLTAIGSIGTAAYAAIRLVVDGINDGIKGESKR